MPYRKLSRCHQDLEELIHKVADLLYMSDICYSILIGGEDIDAFYGSIYNVEVTGIKDGQKITYSIIIKRHHDAPSRSVFREPYKREVAFYSRIVPRYLEIQRNFKIIEGLKIKFPNCIFASDEYDKESIVIMGLLEDGFMYHERFQKMGLEHVLLVAKEMAKLHAFSFVLEKTKPEEFQKIKNLLSKDVQYADPSRQSMSMKCFYNASVNVVSDPVAREKLKELGPNILSILHKCTVPPRYSAICHGDCWTNNILYKYKRKKPIDVILIDYQLMRFASPVTDLAYFLYMSTDREFLSKHYETVLNFYYGTLSAVLRECDLDAAEIYPKKIFESQLREYSVLGLVEALISMMIITAPFEDALKMTEIKYQFCNEGIRESGDNVLFKDRVNDVVDDFFTRNYSLDAVLGK